MDGDKTSPAVSNGKGEHFDFGFTVRPTLRLSRIEEILRDQKIIDPIPSRAGLSKLVRNGTLEGKLVCGFGFVVYEDAFRDWVKSTFGAKKKRKQSLK